MPLCYQANARFQISLKARVGDDVLIDASGGLLRGGSRSTDGVMGWFTRSLATILWLIAIRREGPNVSGWQFLKVGAVAMPTFLLLTLGYPLP
jgi:hypothetical protein